MFDGLCEVPRCAEPGCGRKANARHGLCSRCCAKPDVRARHQKPEPAQYAGPLCRHCKKNKNCRPKGLCWTCSRTPAINDLYTTTSKYARRGTGNHTRASLPPTDKTDSEPGSAEKVAVMSGRAARGESLFRPDEPRVDPARDYFAGLFFVASNNRLCRVSRKVLVGG